MYAPIHPSPPTTAKYPSAVQQKVAYPASRVYTQQPQQQAQPSPPSGPSAGTVASSSAAAGSGAAPAPYAYAPGYDPAYLNPHWYGPNVAYPRTPAGPPLNHLHVPYPHHHIPHINIPTHPHIPHVHHHIPPPTPHRTRHPYIYPASGPSGESTYMYERSVYSKSMGDDSDVDDPLTPTSYYDSEYDDRGDTTTIDTGTSASSPPGRRPIVIDGSFSPLSTSTVDTETSLGGGYVAIHRHHDVDCDSPEIQIVERSVNGDEDDSEYEQLPPGPGSGLSRKPIPRMGIPIIPSSASSSSSATIIRIPEYAASTISELEVEERDRIAKVNASYNSLSTGSLYSGSNPSSSTHNSPSSHLKSSSTGPNPNHMSSNINSSINSRPLPIPGQPAHPNFQHSSYLAQKGGLSATTTTPLASSDNGPSPAVYRLPGGYHDSLSPPQVERLPSEAQDSLYPGINIGASGGAGERRKGSSSSSNTAPSGQQLDPMTSSSRSQSQIYAPLNAIPSAASATQGSVAGSTTTTNGGGGQPPFIPPALSTISSSSTASSIQILPASSSSSEYRSEPAPAPSQSQADNNVIPDKLPGLSRKDTRPRGLGQGPGAGGGDVNALTGLTPKVSIYANLSHGHGTTSSSSGVPMAPPPPGIKALSENAQRRGTIYLQSAQQQAQDLPQAPNTGTPNHVLVDPSTLTGSPPTTSTNAIDSPTPHGTNAPYSHTISLPPTSPDPVNGPGGPHEHSGFTNTTSTNGRKGYNGVNPSTGGSNQEYSGVDKTSTAAAGSARVVGNGPGSGGITTSTDSPSGRVYYQSQSSASLPPPGASASSLNASPRGAEDPALSQQQQRPGSSHGKANLRSAVYTASSTSASSSPVGINDSTLLAPASTSSPIYDSPTGTSTSRSRTPHPGQANSTSGQAQNPPPSSSTSASAPAPVPSSSSPSTTMPSSHSYFYPTEPMRGDKVYSLPVSANGSPIRAPRQIYGPPPPAPPPSISSPTQGPGRSPTGGASAQGGYYSYPYRAGDRDRDRDRDRERERDRDRERERERERERDREDRLNSPRGSDAGSVSSTGSGSMPGGYYTPFPEPQRRYSDGDQNMPTYQGGSSRDRDRDPYNRASGASTPTGSRDRGDRDGTASGRSSATGVRSVRWNDNLICPSPIMPSQRRKGFWNKRGDQLWTNDGMFKQAAAGMEYPPDLCEYPEPGEGWMNEEGTRIDMAHRLIPKVPMKSALKQTGGGNQGVGTRVTIMVSPEGK